MLPIITKSNLNFPVEVPDTAPSLVPPGEVDSRVVFVIQTTLALERAQAALKPDDSRVLYTDCLSFYLISIS